MGVLEKRRLDQVLNVMEFAVAAGISYLTSRKIRLINWVMSLCGIQKVVRHRAHSVWIASLD
jgi:hypothetical protein